MNIFYTQVKPQQIPLKILLEADPSTDAIEKYLDKSWCYAAKQKNTIIAACAIKPINSTSAELFNIAVLPKFQQQGIGTSLLKFTLSELVKHSIQRVELGTGSFGYQLIYYQRLGFRVEAVIKDYFLHHYPEPIFEHGIQHKDMLRLYLTL